MSTQSRRPTGWVAVCVDCGANVAALDRERSEVRELTTWITAALISGRRIEPKFESCWEVELTVCDCPGYHPDAVH